MVRPDKVTLLLAVMRDNVADLRRYARTYSEDELKRSRDAQHQVLHAMFVASQAAIDIANHAVADHALPRAPTYAALFDRLGESGLLSSDLATRMGAWASLRNVLTHFYPIVDLSLVHRALREDLDDFDEFGAAVDGWVRTS